jgi:translation initiation factor 1
MSKKQKDRYVIYSTNPDYKLDEDTPEVQTPVPGQQQLYLVLERHGGGKVATVVEGHRGSQADLTILGKNLKSKCGVGGSVKDGLIIIQGDNRERAMIYLQSLGYKVKMKGG